MKYLLLILILTGCYSEKKARQQFDKAATSFPKIPAEYCADEFPIREETIRDTLRTTDTLYSDMVIYDTIMVQDFDTIRMYITKTLPGKVVTNTIRITDTIIRENTADLKLCVIDKSTLTDLLSKKTAEADKYKGRAKTRGLISLGLLLFILIVTALNIYLKARK